MERCIKQLPVALPEKVWPGAVVGIMAELQRDLSELEIKLLFQYRRDIVRQRPVGPLLVVGGRVPERAEDRDSLVSRAEVEGQLVDKLQ